MVKVRKDLTGQMFGRLKVLHQAEDYINPTGLHYAQWLCECQCEKRTQKIIRASSLLCHVVNSCGCIAKENITLINAKKERKKNKYVLSGRYGIGYASNNPNIVFFFDLEDYNKIKNYTWVYNEHNGTMSSHNFFTETGSNKLVYMQNFISGHSRTSHKNHNKLDNRKQNLRFATHSQSQSFRIKGKNNTSNFIGVSFRTKRQKWHSVISINNKRLHLGSSTSITDMIRLRLQAEYDIYKEFAPQQHLYKEYGIPDTRLHQYLIQKLTDKGYDVNSILA